MTDVVPQRGEGKVEPGVDGEANTQEAKIGASRAFIKIRDIKGIEKSERKRITGGINGCDKDAPDTAYRTVDAGD